MVVRIIYEEGKHDNFYEGNVVTFHPGTEIGDREFEEIIVEGPKGSITIDCEYKKGTKIFLMNDQGKTIQSKYI